MTHVQTPRQHEQGFTLVELAIVMVIIGLLIGGILKGQELINNARITSTVSQLKGIDGALNTFQDKYNALPGDIATPTTRLPNCPAGPCGTAGAGTNGNGRIETAANTGVVTTMPPVASEAAKAFIHMHAADLISGINPTQALMGTFGGNMPTTAVGGGLWLSYTTAAITGTTLPIGRHYASLSGITGANTVATGAFNAITAAQIDRKLDDGRPQSGGTQSIGTGCQDGTIYLEAAGAGTCTMYTRVLN